jgi:group I intron endonuclease
MVKAIVYGIKNRNTGMYYIGSTRKLEARWNLHKSLLESKQHSAKLQAAWDNSEPEDWEWIIIEDNIPVIHQFHSEQHWIDAMDSYIHGYNSSPRAGSYVSIDNRGYQSIIDKREDEMLEMLVQIESGIPYRRIASDFGVSLGFLTKLKERHKDLLTDLIETEQRNRHRIKMEKSEFEKKKADKKKRDHRILEMIEEGCSYREVSDSLGCSLGTVFNVMKRNKDSKSP